VLLSYGGERQRERENVSCMNYKVVKKRTEQEKKRKGEEKQDRKGETLNRKKKSRTPLKTKPTPLFPSFLIFILGFCMKITIHSIFVYFIFIGFAIVLSSFHKTVHLSFLRSFIKIDNFSLIFLFLFYFIFTRLATELARFCKIILSHFYVCMCEREIYF